MSVWKLDPQDSTLKSRAPTSRRTKILRLSALLISVFLVIILMISFEPGNSLLFSISSYFLFPFMMILVFSSIFSEYDDDKKFEAAKSEKNDERINIMREEIRKSSKCVKCGEDLVSKGPEQNEITKKFCPSCLIEFNAEQVDDNTRIDSRTYDGSNELLRAGVVSYSFIDKTGEKVKEIEYESGPYMELKEIDSERLEISIMKNTEKSKQNTNNVILFFFILITFCIILLFIIPGLGGLLLIFVVSFCILFIVARLSDTNYILIFDVKQNIFTRINLKTNTSQTRFPLSDIDHIEIDTYVIQGKVTRTVFDKVILILKNSAREFIFERIEGKGVDDRSNLHIADISVYLSEFLDVEIVRVNENRSRRGHNIDTEANREEWRLWRSL